MTASPTQGQGQTTEPAKANDKELNFRALEARYERQLQVERSAREEAERKVDEARRSKLSDDDDEDSSEPYVDHKKLKKTLNQYGQQAQVQTQNEIQKAVQAALADERKQNWMKQNGDFYEVMQHAEKFAQHDPELAETILQMPEGFERQKLVYKNIKALGLHKEKAKEPSIQEKIDANKHSPYYQPNGTGAAPYSSQSDFSPAGQKKAYEKLLELKSRLRI